MRGVWGALLSMTALVYADTEPFRPKVIFNRECHVGNGSTHLLIQPSFPSSGRGWIMSLMYHVSSSLEGPGTMAGTCVVEKRMIRVDFFSITGRHILQAVNYTAARRPDSQLASQIIRTAATIVIIYPAFP